MLPQKILSTLNFISIYAKNETSWNFIKIELVSALPKEFRKHFANIQKEKKSINDFELEIIEEYKKLTGITLQYKKYDFSSRDKIQKLSKEEIEEIRDRLFDGENWNEIANDFGLTKFDLWRIYESGVSPREKKTNALEAKPEGFNGELNPNARLKQKDVLEIKRRILSGERIGLIAEDFGVSKMLISLIKSGKRWRYLAVE